MITSLSNRLKTLSNHLIYMSSNTIQNIEVNSSANGLLRVTLNRQKALNSLNLQMIKDLTSLLPKMNEHKIVWMEGSGKAFCAGGDVKRLYDAAKLENNLNEARQFFREEFTLDYNLTQIKAIQISNWDGIVMGGGVGISAFSPFIIATQKTMYAMPQAKIGFFTDVGAGYFLSRLRNNIGYYLGMTGARLKGQQVYSAGLANFYIPSQKIPQVITDVEKEISTSKNIRETIHTVLSKYHKGTQTELQNQHKIKEIFGKKSVKEIYHSLKSNNGPFQQSIIKLLEEQCPLSIHVIHKSIQISKNRGLKECIIQDYAISEHFVNGHDFFEGVRCLLVDKGAVPKWTHKHLLDVHENQVAKYFEILDQKTMLKL